MGWIISLSAAAVLPALVGAACAQQPPDGGRILQGTPPPAQLPAKPGAALPQEPEQPAMAPDPVLRVAAKSFRISGARAFSEAELQALLADALGKELGFSDLRQLAARITRHYRERGYLLARAYLPAQRIADGVVEFAVLEGRLGRLNVSNKSSLGDPALRESLKEIREGEALNASTVERRLLLLNDRPGQEIRSTLRPGASVGTTDLDIEVLSKRPVTGQLEFDNFGGHYVGEARLGGAVNLNDPFKLGDTLSMRGFASEGTQYARLSYQFHAGREGLKLGTAVSKLDYKLGKEFAPLRAHGKAAIGTLYALYPLVRGRAANVQLQFAYDAKQLEDRADATGTKANKRIGLWTLGASGDRLDTGGAWNGSVTYVNGRLRLDDATQALDAAGLRTGGSYDKISAQVGRLQWLGERLELRAQASAQWAGKNLDSSEKMTLGGIYGVRAYPSGEIPSDEGVLARIELHYMLAGNWRFIGFADSATGRISKRPTAGTQNNVRSISGAGVGVNWSWPEQSVFLQGFLAWRTAAKATSEVNRNPRAWIQVVKGF